MIIGLVSCSSVRTRGLPSDSRVQKVLYADCINVFRHYLTSHRARSGSSILWVSAVYIPEYRLSRPLNCSGEGKTSLSAFWIRVYLTKWVADILFSQDRRKSLSRAK